LNEGHIETIIEAFAAKENSAHFVKMVTYEAIVANGYNLSVSSYVEAQDNREVIDIDELNSEIAATVAKIDTLRADINTIIAEIAA